MGALHHVRDLHVVGNFHSTDIDDISAKDRTTKLNPTKFQIYAQNRPANPPSINPCVFALNRYEHVVRIEVSGNLHQKVLPHGRQNSRKTQRRKRTIVSL
jgi:hypothetical protein